MQSFKIFTFIILIFAVNKTFGQQSFYTYKDTVMADTVNIAKTNVHSAKKAVLLSAVCPGLGQVYNKQWWKVPIIYAAAAGVIYFAVTNNNEKNKFKNEYYNRINGNTADLLPDYVGYTDAGLYNLYDAYKSNYQLSLIVGVFFYAANILDAYVYGHLFSFEMNEDISMSIIPYANTSKSLAYPSCCGVSFSINF